MEVQVLSSVQIGVSSKTRDQHWAGNVDSNSTIPTNIAEEWNGKSFEAHNLRDSGFDSHLRYKEFSQASYESNVTEQINTGMWMKSEVASIMGGDAGARPAIPTRKSRYSKLKFYSKSRKQNRLWNHIKSHFGGFYFL